MPSMTPIASLYAAIPIAGALIALFTVEQLVNGWRNGFEEPPTGGPHRCRTDRAQARHELRRCSWS